MTLRSRLAGGLLTIAIILVIPMFMAVQSLERLHSDARALEDKEFSGSLLLGRLREGLYSLRNRETALLFLHTATSRDALVTTIGETTRLADSLEHYQLVAAADSVRTEVAQIAQWAPAEYQAALADQKVRADSISESYIVPALERADSSVREAERDLRIRTTRRVADVAATIARDRLMAILAVVLALAIAALVAIWLTRSISRPVTALETGMRAVADGDLAHRLAMNTGRNDEFGRLAHSFEEMSQQLTELDKLKAEFVSVASHELKTPINVIIGYLELLDEGIYGPLSETQLDIHRIIGNQAQALSRLVKQLLDVSRFEAGGGRLEPRRVQLATLLDELEQGFHVLAVQRGIDFTIDRGEGLPLEVTWDPDRIHEVLGNLISNAFKFTQRRGRVEIAVQSDGPAVHFEIRDTGAGISPDQLPRIFEKFYQANNQGAASAHGSGLGLAIAKEIVEAHGGTITCESTPGVGTTFSITLPPRVTRRTASRPVVVTEVAGVS